MHREVEGGHEDNEDELEDDMPLISRYKRAQSRGGPDPDPELKMPLSKGLQLRQAQAGQGEGQAQPGGQARRGPLPWRVDTTRSAGPSVHHTLLCDTLVIYSCAWAYTTTSHPCALRIAHHRSTQKHSVAFLCLPTYLHRHLYLHLHL